MVKINDNGETIFKEEITLSDSYFFKCFEVYIGKELEEDKLVEGIIKVAIDKKNGLNILKNGIEYNNEKYYEIVTTPSGMKIESADNDGTYRVESIFIKEKYKDFIKEFEDSLSVGIISEFKNSKKEICINKMVTSKKALAMTGTDFIEGMPNILLVDEFEYNYTSLYSYLTDDNKIDSKAITMNFVLNDGGGLMSPSYANKIKKSLNINYKVEFAIIRGYSGLAIKGVLLNFDFAKYIKSQYKGDTSYLKKRGTRYYIKDYFGGWRDLDKIECIINKSQAKYLGEYRSKVKEGYPWEEVIEDYYKDSKYKYINDGLYVCKVNKNPKTLKGRIKLNYQVLQNLNISAEDLIDIAKEVIEEYKNVIELNDINYIKLALGDWVTDIEGSATITNKIDLVIDRFGQESLDWKFIRKTLKKHLMKRVKLLAGGKIPVDGEVCMGVCCPITFCNFLMSGARGTNGLKEGEFYQGGDIGTRLSYRNPIAYYGEITEIELVKHELLEEYTSEILFVNGFDDFLFIKSTADLDGDMFGVVNNKTLIDSVIKEEAPFVNLNDTDDVKHEFTREQAYEDLWESSGNVIGEIAINNSKLCAEVTGYNALIDKKGRIAYYATIRKEWCEKNDRITTFVKFKSKCHYFENRWEYEMHNDQEDETTWDEYCDFIKENWSRYQQQSSKLFNVWIEEEGIKFVKEFDLEEKNELRKRLFKKYKNSFFKILLASQIAIDMPKKLVGIPTWLQKDLNEFSDLYKPRFMHYLNKCACKGKGDIKKCKDILNKESNNVMDKYCKFVEKELIQPLSKLDIGNHKPNVTFISVVLGDMNGEINEELKSIYKENSNLRRLYRGNRIELDKADINTSIQLEELGKLDIDTVAATLKKLKAEIRFNFNFMFDDYFKPKLLKMKSKTGTMVIDPDGIYKWNGLRYRVDEINKTVDIEANKKDQLKKMVKLGLCKRVRFHKSYYYEEVEELTFITVKNMKCEALGKMYADKKDTVLQDGEYEILHKELDKSGKGITVWVK